MRPLQTQRCGCDGGRDVGVTQTGMAGWIPELTAFTVANGLSGGPPRAISPALAGRHRRQTRPHHAWAGQRAGGWCCFSGCPPSRPFHYRCLASTASTLDPHHAYLVLLLLLFRCWRVDYNLRLCPFFSIFPLQKQSTILGLAPSPYRKSHSQRRKPGCARPSCHFVI